MHSLMLTSQITTDVSVNPTAINLLSYEIESEVAAIVHKYYETYKNEE